MGTPVKVFRSTDPGAPQIPLVKTKGFFKAILKACLVTGYGSGDDYQQPLGWEIVEGTETEDGNQAAFRPTDPESARNVIHCNHSVANHYANMTGYFDVNAEGQLLYPSSAWQLHVYNSNTSSHQWILVGHARSFALMVRWTSSGSNSDVYSGQRCTLFFFGEFANRVNNHRANTVIRVFPISGSFYNNSTYSGRQVESEMIDPFTEISQSENGLTYWYKCYPIAPTYNITIGYAAINGDLIFSPIGLIGATEFRGNFPFGFCAHHHLIDGAFTELTINGQQHLLVPCGRGVRANETSRYSMPLLVNLEEWAV